MHAACLLKDFILTSIYEFDVVISILQKKYSLLKLYGMFLSKKIYRLSRIYIK